MKKIIMSAAAASVLVAASQANAALYAISYDFAQVSQYTVTTPLDPSGQPDPTDAVNGSTHGSSIGPGQADEIPFVPVVGTGTLNTDTGEIYLAPISFETTVVSGSTGVVGWSQTLNGAFSGTTFTMAGDATVNGGSLVCEGTSAACDGAGGVGAAPVALEVPQLFEIVQTGCNPLGFGCTDTPVTTVTGTVEFDALATGGTGQYLFQGSTEPDYTITTINFAIGAEVSAVPVPAAAWLFGSALIGLAGVGRKRSQV